MTTITACNSSSSASSAARMAAMAAAFSLASRRTPSAAEGSGVVVDRNGYILTNNHVVEKATRIKVKFMNDDTEYTARVIGTDQDTDLAVIKVDRTNLVAAKIGNSDAMQVGDWAVAIGSPFGFQETVTAGIISAIGTRHWRWRATTLPALHSDGCGHQSRQQRRPAAEHQWRSDRHQHHDRQPQRRISGNRFRHADQYRGEGL